jgi:hypothetical protein
VPNPSGGREEEPREKTVAAKRQRPYQAAKARPLRTKRKETLTSPLENPTTAKPSLTWTASMVTLKPVTKTLKAEQKLWSMQL